MSILVPKKIKCEQYIDMMAELDVSQVESSEHHIIDDSKVYVDYPCGREVNYGDLYVRIAHTSITDNFILEEFIIKAYRVTHMHSPVNSISNSANNYFNNTSLIPIKTEEIKKQFKQWFNDKELKKLHIDFSKILESVYIGEIDFYGDVGFYGYQGFMMFVAGEKIYYVNFISSI